MTQAPGDNLAAMYHYVRPENSEGVVGITPEHFAEQVRAMAARYRMVTVEEYIALQGVETGMGLVTFDDAVRDQYEYAFPILEELGVPSVIFAPMRPYADVDDPWTTQHLLHALAQELGFAELERRVDRILGEVEFDADEMNRVYHYEYPERRRLKFLLAFVLPQEQVRPVLAQVNADIGLRAEDWFMTADQLNEVQHAGHAIGGHGFDHVPYATMTAKEQAADMHRERHAMSGLLGTTTGPLAYPYGSYTRETPLLAAGCGYTYCFTVEERVDAKDLDERLRSSDPYRRPT